MADSQDKLTQADQKTLEELEKKLAKEKTAGGKKDETKSSNGAHTPSEEKVTKPTQATSGASTQTKSSKVVVPPRKTTTQSKAKTGALWFFTIINFLFLVSILGASYWVWLQWQGQNQQQAKTLVAQQNNINKQQSEIAQSISSNQLVKDELQQQTQALQSSIENLVTQLQVTNSQVETNQKNLSDVSGRRPADWLLAEADYLVRMAGRKLWLEHDVKTASMMLQSADNRLQDLDDPSLLPVRQKLAQDMQALQQINQISTSSIALSLGALSKQVDNLPLAFFKKPAEEETEDSVTDSISDWRSNLARNWRKFTKGFFSYKKVTTEIKPFMSEQQQWLAKEQLKFSLLQAQVAVLRENKTLYDQSLQRSLSLLIEFFDTKQSSVDQFTDSVSNLNQTNIERVYPAQFETTPILQDIIDQRLSSQFVNGSQQ